MILNELHPGERGRVTGIDGGHCFQQKLALRGVAEGCTLTMVSSSCCGPVAVEVRGSTLALGRCMARHIQVVKVE
ncbi:FeoA family protein [Methanogenium sp. MK-MG]|uniref:FeoA family protein n=1 Tax=Methanogenium sp. MK-MG TaxID=2599926 RepID=UPI0013EA0C1B|nr:FeoA family protein [Methanogenium sp. MK-MG]